MTAIVNFVRLDPGLPTPKFQTDGAVGLDLYSSISSIVPANSSMIVPTGISIGLQPGWKAMIHGRSGLGFKKDVVPFMGTIDTDYRGEIYVKLFNLGDKDFHFNRGDRICQLCIEPAPQAILRECVTLDETKRGGDGFGHTGR